MSRPMVLVGTVDGRIRAKEDFDMVQYWFPENGPKEGEYIRVLGFGVVRVKRVAMPYLWVAGETLDETATKVHASEIVGGLN